MIYEPGGGRELREENSHLSSASHRLIEEEREVKGKEKRVSLLVSVWREVVRMKIR